MFLSKNDFKLEIVDKEPSEATRPASESCDLSEYQSNINMEHSTSSR